MKLADRALAAQVEAVRADVVSWRRHLHAHPELSYQEHETSRFVRELLAGFGGLDISSPTPTSVVAELVGGIPGGCLALRADMDALPITEESGSEFASQNHGVMHACGHDGHTAMLLGVARALTGLRSQLPGRVRLVFQHAEELAPGGAQELVAQGVMDGVDAVIGAHLDSLLEVGRLGLVAGPMMASSDEFAITVRGVGGHAAEPEHTVDSVAIAAEVVTNLQYVVARNTDPQQPLVVAVSKLQAGTAENVTPGTAELAGTVRTFSDGVRAAVPGLMERVVRGITQAHGASYDFEFKYGSAAVVNDPVTTERVRAALRRTFGADGVVDFQPTMGAEDFSAYQERAPSTYFMVGAGNPERGIIHPHHHARFSIDESALSTGVQALLSATFALLPQLGPDRPA